MASESGWFAVRCVFLHGEVAGGEEGTYEERITLWNLSSAELAIERAEAEAKEYVVDLQGVSSLGWRSRTRSLTSRATGRRCSR